ncbi:MAG: hypothetical protein J7515_16970 [Caulobacter sp.]|nr:hypothetical protein [Caulobacter sp.]
MKPIASPSWRAWAGLWAGAIGWSLHHQTMSNGNFARCPTMNGLTDLGVGTVAIVIILAGGFLSWTAWRRASGGPETSHEASGRFIPALSLMAAGLFLLTVLVQIGAGLIVPACWR